MKFTLAWLKDHLETTATVDAINTSFGLAKQRFYQQYDSNTHQTMFHGNDTFDLILHPAVIAKLERGYLSNASAELDFSQSLFQKIQGEFNIIPSFSTDAAYDGAAATEAQFTMMMNTTENFQIVESIPYTVEPWQFNPATDKWRMRAYWKIFPLRKAYNISGSWKKAVVHGRVTPYATA